MANDVSTQIRTYEDLLVAKEVLKSDIRKQEHTFSKNPVFKISSSIFDGNSLKDIIKSPLDSFTKENLIKTAEKLLSTFLLANKKTRGIYIGFIVAKEMIPFTLLKINEILKKK